MERLGGREIHDDDRMISYASTYEYRRVVWQDYYISSSNRQTTSYTSNALLLL